MIRNMYEDYMNRKVMGVCKKCKQEFQKSCPLHAFCKACGEENRLSKVRERNRKKNAARTLRRKLQREQPAT